MNKHDMRSMVFTATHTDKIYLGSSRDDSIGVGNLIRGTEYRRTDSGFEILLFDGEWLPVYDVVLIKPLQCEMDHPDIEQPGTTVITWV